MQFGYPYLIRLFFFNIQSNPDPVLNCRIRLERDPETESCSTLVHTSGVQVYRIQNLESNPAGLLDFLDLVWISFSFQPDSDPDYPNEIKCGPAKNLGME